MNKVILEKLSQADPLMAHLIEIIGPLNIHRRDDGYQSLLRSIVGQQLSAKVASVINERLRILANQDISPETILSLSDDRLREIGLSFRKISYIRDLSEKVMNKDLFFDHLSFMGNESVIHTLTQIKGIGRWTAEMFLIFSMGRLDVLSLLDVGLQRGVKWLYSAPKEADGMKLLQDKGKKWPPYQSVASLYLWEIVNRDYVTSFTSYDEYIQTKKPISF